jgi:hypothetical protein
MKYKKVRTFNYFDMEQIMSVIVTSVLSAMLLVWGVAAMYNQTHRTTIS